MRVILLLALAACTIKERDQHGPSVHIEMEQSFIQVSDELGGDFELGTEPSYSIDIRIPTQPGEEDDASSTSYSPVESIDATFSVPGIDVPAVSYTKDATSDDVTFTSSAPLVIPASAKGQVMAIHVAGKDGNGLSSNVIDFTASFK